METTSYPSVYSRSKKRKIGNKIEKIFYIKYRDTERVQHQEKVGSSIKHNVTGALANIIRAARESGKEAPTPKKEKTQRLCLSEIFDNYMQVKKFKNPLEEQNRFDRYLLKDFGNKKLEQIDFMEVAKFRKKLEQREGKEKISAATIVKILGVLRKLSNFVEMSNMCKGLPFKKIDMPLVDNQVNEALNPKPVKNICELADKKEKTEFDYFYLLMLFTGRRTGDILSLRKQDVDFKKKLITFRDTKTGKQVIPVSDFVLKLLKDFPMKHPEIFFPDKFQNPRTRFDGEQQREKANRLEIPAHFRSSYCCRHTFASISLSYEVPERIFQIFIGHSTGKGKGDVTGRYAHAFRKKLFIEINKMTDHILSYSRGEFEGELTPANLDD